MAWAPFLLALTAAVTSCAGTKEAMDKRGIEMESGKVMKVFRF